MKYYILSAALMLFPFCHAWEANVSGVGNVGGMRSGGGAIIFQPLASSGRDLHFAQVGLGNFHEVTTASLGLGFRRLHSCSFGYGANLFGDFGYSSRREPYGQLGLGGELFGSCWVVRANGYLPTINKRVGDTQLFRLAYERGTSLIGQDILISRSEKAYRGFDIEAGYGLSILSGGLWAYGGFYYFNAPNFQEQYGPRARVEYRHFVSNSWGGEIRLGVEYEHDQIHGSRVSGVIDLRIPLCRRKKRRPCEINSLCYRMSDPVRRERGLWVESHEERRIKEFPLETRLFFVTEAGTPTNLGTQKVPMSLSFATSGDPLAPGPGDIMILMENDGTALLPIDASTANGGLFTLSDSQTVGGFGGNDTITLVVDGQELIIETCFPNPGRGTLTQSQIANIMDLATGNEIFGIAYDGLGNAPVAITGTSVSDISFSDVIIQNATQTGIALSDVTNTIIDQLQIESTGDLAIQVVDGTNLSLTDSTISNFPNQTPSIFDGVVFLQDVGGTTLIENNDFTDGVGFPYTQRFNTTGGAVSFQNNQLGGSLLDPAGAGASWSLDSATPVLLDIVGNTAENFIDPLVTETPVFSILVGGEGDHVVKVVDNVVANSFSHPVFILSSPFFGGTPQTGTYNFLVEGNSLSDAIEAGIAIAPTDAVGANLSTLNVTVRSNTITRTGSDSINDSPGSIFISPAATLVAQNTMNLLIENNRMVEGSFSAVWMRAAGNGTYNATIRDNEFVDNEAGRFAINAVHLGQSPNTCFNIVENVTNRTNASEGLQLDQNNLGAMGANLNTLVIDNPGMPTPFFLLGTIADQPNCPLPPPISP